MNKNYEFLPHEYNHLMYLKEHAYECSLFLKREDNAFPIKKACPITLIGNGVRHTIIGGTGSGAVNVKYKETIEEAFINAGFTINSGAWLDKYDEEYLIKEKEFVSRIKKEAKAHKTIAATYSMGKNAPEREYDFPIEGDKKVAIYVLSRNAGEGSDRELVKGDVYLTDTEIRDILYLNKNYKKFLLVLNVPGVIDLEPVLEVKNILLLSQLGSLTGDILVDIVLGKKNPCGKLTTTWAKIKDYSYINTPISEDECIYNEGVYVGYRYFSSFDVTPLFPFGYGLSYSKFEYKLAGYFYQGDKINLKVKVTNVGPLKGKETIELYLRGKKDLKQELVSFNKTQILDVNNSEELVLEFKLSDFASYDEKLEAYAISKGNYVLSIGTSSDNLTDALNVVIEDDVIIHQVKNVFNAPKIDELKKEIEPLSLSSKVPTIHLNKNDFPYWKSKYDGAYKVKVPEVIKKMSDLDLILMSLGDYKTGVRGMVGQSCSLIQGGAGETTLRVKDVPNTLNMVDGPAGLRFTQAYVLNSKGSFPLTSDSVWDGLEKYLPKVLTYFLSYKRNLKKKGSKVYQIATALPIATALAQSFNPGFIYGCGRLVREEAELYGIDIWLAPGSNIHRSILCGRNFEYYSEDPFVSSVCASNIINAFQENGHNVATVKHFALNNQESNRINNNSICSERAIREIYLRTFEKITYWSRPKAIMSSYNLINGEHASSNKALLVDILRNEWGYRGVVMTDWIASGQTYKKNNKYPAAFASKNLHNGNNLCMPGSKKDIKDIKKALKSGKLTRTELENNASIIYYFVNDNKS